MVCKTSQIYLKRLTYIDNKIVRVYVQCFHYILNVHWYTDHIFYPEAGCGFDPRLSHTKNHQKNDTNCTLSWIMPTVHYTTRRDETTLDKKIA